MHVFSASKIPRSLKDFGGKEEAWLAPASGERLAGVIAEPQVSEPTSQDWSRARPGAGAPQEAAWTISSQPQHCREAGPLPDGHPGPFSKATPVGTL